MLRAIYIQFWGRLLLLSGHILRSPRIPNLEVKAVMMTGDEVASKDWRLVTEIASRFPHRGYRGNHNVENVVDATVVVLYVVSLWELGRAMHVWMG